MLHADHQTYRGASCQKPYNEMIRSRVYRLNDSARPSKAGKKGGINVGQAVFCSAVLFESFWPPWLIKKSKM